MTPAHRQLRLLAVASHPIQYQAPWFRALAHCPDWSFEAMFIERPDAKAQGQGFGVPFTWDIPLLEGYDWRDASDVRAGRPGYFSRWLRRPVALLRELQPDVLLLTGWHMAPLVQLLWAARRLRIPVLMRAESNALRARPWHVRWLHRRLLESCAAFLTIGRANRAFFEGYGVTPDRLFDAPYFVDNDRFASRALQCDRSKSRATWSVPDEAVCFCYAGKLEPKKRILDLLEAFRLAVPRVRQPIHLLVIGTGELMPQAQALVAQHALPVTFAGFVNQSDIPCAYAACDALVLPSDFGETWGLVVNEAMACGLPAIVSDRVGCSSDLVVDGVTGSVFAFGDVGALADRVVDYAQNARQRASLGRAAHEHVAAHYTIARSVEATRLAVARVLHPS